MINFLPFIDGESIIERITDLELVSYVDGDIIDMADGPRDEAPLVSLVIQRTGPYSKINHHFYIVTDGDGWAQIADTYIDDDVDNLDAYGKWVSRPTLATITLSNEDVSLIWQVVPSHFLQYDIIYPSNLARSACSILLISSII